MADCDKHKAYNTIYRKRKQALMEKSMTEQKRFEQMAIKIGRYYGLTEAESLRRLRELEERERSSSQQENGAKENVSSQ